MADTKIVKVPTVILLKESLWVSWGRDLVTFGWLLGGLFLNHRYLGDSWMVTLTLCIGLFVFAGAKGKTMQYTPEEAIAKLKSMKAEGRPDVKGD